MHQEKFRLYDKPFEALTPSELYAIMRLRIEVFIVEQHCIFQDADNKDQQCHHLMIWEDDQLVAYARLVPPGLSFAEMSIGRVISSPAYRRTGAGKLLMQEAINACYTIFGRGSIKIGAQLYLKKFYESFGFMQCGEIYLEDDIRHLPMIRLMRSE